MVQRILLTLEIDDSALDTAQAKADKLIATLKEAEGLMAKRTQVNQQAQDGNFRDLWQEAFDKGLVAIPPPEQPQTKEKPPEGGKSTGNVEVKDWTPPEGYGSCAHAWDANFWKKAAESDNFVERLVIARTLAKKATADAADNAVDDAIKRTAQAMFKPPD